MAYDGVVTELPAGLAGMVNHENRLLSGRQELSLAEGVVFEDNHIRQEQQGRRYGGDDRLRRNLEEAAHFLGIKRLGAVPVQRAAGQALGEG